MFGSAAAILAASLLGSVHCAAMCGGFVCFYTGSALPGASLVRAHALYNVGRLISYLFLGALAGAVGVGVTHLGALAGVGHAATIVAGTMMIGWALATFAVQRGIHIGLPSTPQWWQRFLGGALRRLGGRSLAVRALFTGLATTLLPCGWLYVFVAAAGGTGRMVDGMILMAVFWLGSVPAMVAIGMGAQRAFGPLRQRLPALGAMTVFVLGILAMSGRLVLTSGLTTHVH
ncbi:MAG: sulfite exporter TauE/SafE family protein [bacterium]